MLNLKKFTPLKNKVASALAVAEYLLSLDPQRKYFTLKRMPEKEGWIALPMEGNFRLNKLLHILQILYYAKHERMLFTDSLVAYEHGGVVQIISKSFGNELYYRQKYLHVKELSLENKSFIKKGFNYFSEYDNQELWDFSHDDPSWQQAWEKGFSLAMPQNSHIRSYWKTFYKHVVEEMEEDETEE
jgi:uncharacterized phage-associated protein